MIGNGTRQLAVGFPPINTIILINGVKSTPSDIICSEVVPIGLPSSDSVHNIPNIVFKCEYQPPIIVNPLKAFVDNQPLEIRTYLNMTNKTFKRAGKEDVEIKDIASTISTKYPIQFIDGNNFRLKRDYWTYGGISQTYWGTGTSQRDTGFIHTSIVLEETVFIPSLNHVGDIQSRECVLSIINHLSTSSYIINTLIRSNITIETNPEIIPIYQRYMEPILGSKKSSIPIQVVDSSVRNVFGGKGTLLSSYPNEMKNYGFVPHLVRMANQSINKVQKDESATSEIDVGLIIGEKWGDVIMNTVIKDLVCSKVSWKIIKTLTDGTPQDFMNAKYIIGSQTSNAWAGLLFINPEKCRIIEIDYEHDANLAMYHVGIALGVSNYQILPLKHEPVSRCEKRIRDNLLKYIHE